MTDTFEYYKDALIAVAEKSSNTEIVDVISAFSKEDLYLFFYTAKQVIEKGGSTSLTDIKQMASEIENYKHQQPPVTTKNKPKK